MKSKLKILVCPLDWGIGHATRCVPVIKKLLELNTEVIIASDGRPLAFLKNEFPDIKYIHFPGYHIQYPSKGKMIFKMLMILPGIFLSIYKEHRRIKKIIRNQNIDGIFSDNRFGLFNKLVPSVYMSHQIYIQAPRKLSFLKHFFYRTHKFFINKYHYCWIPDFPGKDNLSGILSHSANKQHNYRYTGPLSRFSLQLPESNFHCDHEILAMISGPEPQRSIFMNEIINQLKTTEKKCLVLSGTPEKKIEEEKKSNITILPHLKSQDLKKAIKNAKIIICRSGYSTLMDISLFNKKAILIPTPGQTEQEYLAGYHAQKKHCVRMNQKNMNIKHALELVKNTRGFYFDYDDSLLHNAIVSFIQKVKCNVDPKNEIF